MRARLRWIQALSCAALTLGALAAPEPAWAQSDQEGWSVQGGSARQREIMRRYKSLLERNPTEGLAFKKLVEMSGGGAGLDRLIEEYQDKTKAQPERLNYWLILGHLLRQREDYEAAAAAYEEAVALDKDSALAHLGRGKARLMLQQNDQATADFERALELESERSRKQEILRKLADLAFAQRKWEQAQSYYGRLIELDPRNEFLRLEYAEVLVKHKRYAEALAQYEELLELAGRDTKARATTLRDMGDLYEQMGEDKEAIATYEKAMRYVRPGNWLYRELQQRVIGVYRRADRLEEYLEQKEKQWRRPNYDQAMLLAGIYDELGREEQAYDKYERASRLRRRAVDPRLKMIQILQRRADIDGVIDAYESLIRVAPRQARFQFDLARVHARNGDRDAAERLLGRIRKRFRRDTDVLVTLADTYMRLGMKDEALGVYKQLVRAEPRNESFITSLGEYYYQAGESTKAAEVWERLLRSELPRPRAHAQLGLLFVEHNMIEEGIRHYERARELAPDDRDIQRGLALAYELGRRWDKAVATWRALMDDEGAPAPVVEEARGRIITLYKRQNRLRSKMREFTERFRADPPDLEAGFFLAEAYVKLGEPGRAERIWRAIIDADGVVDAQDIPALVALEQIHVQRAEHAEAIEVLRKLAELRPARAREYYHRIAELSLKTYEDDQAVRYARLALKQNPNDANAHARLAEVYAEMQRVDDAIEEYRVALDLDPRAFGVHFELAALLLERGQRAEAAALYREVATGSSDEDMILRAARRAMALAETREELELLEQRLAPLVFKSPPRTVYRKLLLELYARLISPLVAQRDFGAQMDEADRVRLEAMGDRAFPVLMDALASQDIGQRQAAVQLLGELEHPNAALALGRMVDDEEDPLRLHAAIAVARIGDERAQRPLERALGARDPAIHDAAAWALGALEEGTRSAPLLAALEEGRSSRLQTVAALSLGRLGERRAVGPMLELLEAARLHRYSDQMTVTVALALGMIGQPRAVGPLTDVLRRSNSRAGDAAAWALGRIGGDEAARALLMSYWSQDQSLRERARRGLIWLVADGQGAGLSDRRAFLREARFIAPRDQSFAVEDLVEHLAERARFVPLVDPAPLVHDHGQVLAQVVRARLRDGDGGAQAALLEDLTRPSGLLGLGSTAQPHQVAQALRELLDGLHPQLRQIAAGDDAARARASLELLGALGDPADRALLLEHLEAEDAPLRAAATLGLSRGFLAHPLARQAVIARLADEHFTVRAAAAEGLGHAPAKARSGAIDALDGALDDDYVSVRLEAVRALGRLGPQAIGALSRALEDDRPQIRRAALRQLVALGGPQAEAALEPWRDHPDRALRAAARGR